MKSARTTVCMLILGIFLAPGALLAQEQAVTVSININAMSTGDASAHERLEADTRALLNESLAELSGLEVVRANADLLLSVSVIQVDEDTFACSSMSFAYSPACIGLVLFETGVFGKQHSLESIVKSIVQDFDVNTLVPYKRTKD